MMLNMTAWSIPKLAERAADEDKPYGWSRNLEYRKRGKASAKLSPSRNWGSSWNGSKSGSPCLQPLENHGNVAILL